MAKIKAFIGSEKYRVELESASGKVLIADEPLSHGGKDAGFSPKELLASSLAACTSITLKMYAERKAWPLERVDVIIDLEFNSQNNETKIKREIVVTGELDAEQKQSLLNIANKCPLHKILTNSIDIESTLT